LDWFSSNFEKLALEPLSGEFKGAFKLRIGDWRVVYTVGGKSITVQFIGNRKDIHKVK
jgi:mRNA interferase RelE/StbE